MEYLRHVVGSGEVADRELVSECARGVASFIDDPLELVPVCQRLIAHQPQSAALLWFCARLLAAFDPRDELASIVAELRLDGTDRLLAAELPADGVVAIVGSDALVLDAALERPDVTWVVIDSLGLGDRLMRRLERADHAVEKVGAESAGIAAASCDLVLVEAVAASPDRIVGLCGSRAVLAVAAAYQRPTLVAVARGRSMPDTMLAGMLVRLGERVDTPDALIETVPATLVPRLLDHRGTHSRLGPVDVPDVTELR